MLRWLRPLLLDSLRTPLLRLAAPTVLPRSGPAALWRQLLSPLLSISTFKRKKRKVKRSRRMQRRKKLKRKSARKQRLANVD